jgi:hypothetical protein
MRRRRVRRALREWRLDLLLVITSGVVIAGILKGLR